MIRATIATAALAFVAGCAAPPGAGPAGGADYAFVVLGEEGTAVARVITSATTCPAIVLDDAATTMDVRAHAATVPLRPTRSDPAQSKPSAFPVVVCESRLPPGVRSARVRGSSLPLPKPAPKRIVVLGDTGCRIKASENAFQACNDGQAWPFAAVADAAADAAPDLVIHVGDYHYRENECPVENAGCAGSPWGYGWDAWEADFFAPARRLLTTAPWIVVRGNHESCNRAGQGWWRFLDPRPLVPRQDCNAPTDDAVGDFSEPYAVPLGFPSTDSQFIVFDSSFAAVNALPASDPAHVRYRAQLERAFVLGARHPQTFFVDHHPILALAPNPGRPGAPYPGNGALQSVLATLQPTVLFPPNVQALLAGHVHLFEVVSFSTPQPAQFVAGNGGTVVDSPLPSPLPAGTTPMPGAVVSAIVATNRFGFMTMERDGDRWSMVARDARGAPMTTCTLRERHASCAPLAPR